MEDERRVSGARVAVSLALFALCCVADLFVLRPVWTGRRIVEGQFRRGYFEPFADGVGLAVDDVIRPVFPACVLMSDGTLAVPPGMTTVMPLGKLDAYRLTSEAALAPYVVIGAEAPLAEEDDRHDLPGEARLVGGRTLALQAGRLVLVPWDPLRPWRQDAARLSELRDGCAVGGEPLALDVATSDGRLELHLGRCALAEPLAAPPAPTPLLSALAGPEWITIGRHPGWEGDRWIEWKVLAVVGAKVAALWWGLGLLAAVTASAVLAGAALVVPVLATLTWPVMLVVAVASATVRAAARILRRLPQRARIPAVLGFVALLAGAALLNREPPAFNPIMRTHKYQQGDPDACAVLGYSAAGGASLRGADLHEGRQGLRWFLDQDCERCREQTGALFAGGETLAWARDAYCATAPSFGAHGPLVFFGGANDDFFWGVSTLARLFVVGEQGPGPWRGSQGPAAAASLAHIDAQTAAIDDLLQCAQSRQAQVLFLHDFLITDMIAGREPDRAAMLDARRAAVQAAGGTFVDLLDTFAGEAGIAWFNDYVHPSLVAHQRIAELACRLAR